MLFSIVIPIYNAESTLNQCIQSVLDQSYEDWEMILVNDGSTDGSKKIIDSFVIADNRIRSIEQRNSGQLLARRSGIENAQGDYLLFLDSDDYWSTDCLSVLADQINEKSPDVIMFPARRIGDSRHDQEVLCCISERSLWIEKQDFYRVLIAGVDYNSLCLKVWRRTLFDGDTTEYRHYSKVLWGEDRIQLLYPITKAKNILFIPDALYYYVDNPASVTHRIEVSRIPAMLNNDAFSLLYTYMKCWGMDSPEYREVIAVQYLRNFGNIYYNLRKACKTKADRQKFRKYPWHDVVSEKAFSYLFSGKLTHRERFKIILARYLNI